MESYCHLPSVPCSNTIHVQRKHLVPLVWCGFPCLLCARDVLAKFCAKRFLK